MLILSKDYVEEHGGNGRNLALSGQENNGGVWAISKMNLLLHGIPDADMRNNDDGTLEDPLHTEGGELMRFDRVITNPPFSLNYTQGRHPIPRALPVRLVPRERQEGRPDVRPAHAGRHCDRRHGRDGHATRRAVPWRRRTRDPQAVCSTTTSSTPSSAWPATSSMAPAFLPASSSCAQRARSRQSAGARCCSSTPTRDFTARVVPRTTSSPNTSRRSFRPIDAFGDIPGFARVVTRRGAGRER